MINDSLCDCFWFPRGRTPMFPKCLLSCWLGVSCACPFVCVMIGSCGGAPGGVSCVGRWCVKLCCCAQDRPWSSRAPKSTRNCSARGVPGTGPGGQLGCPGVFLVANVCDVATRQASTPRLLVVPAWRSTWCRCPRVGDAKGVRTATK